MDETQAPGYKGNVRVGEQAWYRPAHGEWSDGWTVAAVGLTTHENGNPVHIRIARGTQSVVLNAYPNFWDPKEPSVLVVPSADERAPVVVDALREYSNLFPVRSSPNHERGRGITQLVCRRCMEALYIEERSVEVCELRAWDGRSTFDQGKPEMQDGASACHS